MSGHNKWSTIKHKKGAADAKRGKVFSRLAKEITIAAKAGGGDADLNPSLRAAIIAARAANMPNDNVERAVKKGTGELGGEALEEIYYELYGPGGVALFVKCLTDNRNRTAANIRAIVTKGNATMAASGAVSRLYARKSVFQVTGPDASEERLLELLLEGGVDVEDVVVDGEAATIKASPSALGDISDLLGKVSVTVQESGVRMVPLTTTPVAEVSAGRQLLRLIDLLEDDDDVQEVYSNFEMSDDLMATLASE